MLNYNLEETKKAIYKVIPVGMRIAQKDLTNVKWMLILNDGFEKKGWLNESVLLHAFGCLKNSPKFNRYRDPETGERFYIRIAQ